MRPSRSSSASVVVGVDPSTTGGYWAVVDPQVRAVVAVGRVDGSHAEVYEAARTLLGQYGGTGVVELLPPYAPPQRRVAHVIEAAYYAGVWLAAGYIGVRDWRRVLGVRDDDGVRGLLGILATGPRRWNAHHRDAALMALAYGLGLIHAAKSADDPDHPRRALRR